MKKLCLSITSLENNTSQKTLYYLFGVFSRHSDEYRGTTWFAVPETTTYILEYVYIHEFAGVLVNQAKNYFLILFLLVLTGYHIFFSNNRRDTCTFWLQEEKNIAGKMYFSRLWRFSFTAILIANNISHTFSGFQGRSESMFSFQVGDNHCWQRAHTHTNIFLCAESSTE